MTVEELITKLRLFRPELQVDAVIEVYNNMEGGFAGGNYTTACANVRDIVYNSKDNAVHLISF